MTTPVDLVTSLVEDVINSNRPDRLDELCSPKLAAQLRSAFSQFRRAFPDWSQRILETITDGRTVVARMRCTGTHQGHWQGLEPTGRTMRRGRTSPAARDPCHVRRRLTSSSL